MNPARERHPIPRHDDDHTSEAARERRDFVRERTGASLEHVASNSFHPDLTRGNIEQFTGVAQVPIGIAGPLLVDGEHARASTTSRWRRPRARSSPATTAG